MRMSRRQATRHQTAVPRIPKWVINVAFWLAIGTPLLAGGVLGVRHLMEPETFPVRTIRVNGEFRYLTRQALEEAVAPHVGQGLLRVTVDQIRTEVERLPWVRSAQVRRIWPEGLEVRVTEQLALARWGSGGLVNLEGALFSAPADSGPQGLPELTGPEGSSTLVTAHYRKFSTTLEQAGLMLVRLELDQRNAWRLHLNDGLVVDLGREDVARRLQRFARLHKQFLAKDSRRLERVDLRYANGFAVQFAGVDETPADGKRQGALSKGELANAKKG